MAAPSGGEGLSENLRKALEDLRGAGEKATGDVRSRIDSAVQRLNDASTQATTRAQEQVSKAQEQAGKATERATGLASDQIGSWRETLDKATDEARVQLAKLAARAQNSLEGVDAVEKELRARAKELGRKPKT
jgi:uncharacterized protein YjbJ (UPF0337 family)